MESRSNSAPLRLDLSSRAFRLLVVLVVALAGWIQLRTLAAFFGSDDLIHLEQALALLPPPASPLRFLSEVVYFRAMLSLFGPNALPFHVASLALHSLNIVLLALVLRRAGLSRTFALLAVALHSCHPLAYASLLYAVNINDIAALALFLVATRLVCFGTPFASAAAFLAFVASLFTKESVVLLPALLPWLCARAPRNDAVRFGIIGIGLTAIVFLASLPALLALGRIADQNNYSVAFGPNIVTNAGTYLAWFSNLRSPFPDTSRMSWSPVLVLVGTALAVLVACIWQRAHRFPLTLGAAWFVVAALPVLILADRTYPHYLYVSAVGLSLLAVGLLLSVVDAVAPRLHPDRFNGFRLPVASGGRRQLAVAAATAAVVIAFAMRAHTLVQARALTVFPGTTLPRDPMTRKSTIAQRAIGGLANTLADTTSCVVLYSPPLSSRVYGARSGRRYQSSSDSLGVDLLRAVLDNGRAIRVFLPHVTSVTFTSKWDGLLSHCHLVLRDEGERLIGFGVGNPAAGDLSIAMLRAGAVRQALTLATELFEADSSRSEHRAILALALAANADTAAARRLARGLEGAQAEHVLEAASRRLEILLPSAR